MAVSATELRKLGIIPRDPSTVPVFTPSGVYLGYSAPKTLANFSSAKHGEVFIKYGTKLNEKIPTAPLNYTPANQTVNYLNKQGVTNDMAIPASEFFSNLGSQLSNFAKSDTAKSLLNNVTGSDSILKVGNRTLAVKKRRHKKKRHMCVRRSRGSSSKGQFNQLMQLAMIKAISK